MTIALDPVRTTLDLMAIDSTSGNETAVVAFTDQLLRARGWDTARIPVSTGRDCVFAWGRGRGKGSNTADVVYSTHLDTVPPFIPPRVNGDVIHGRGACDAKGIAASMMVAAERLRDGGLAVGLLFVVGEETSHDGAHAANAWVQAHLPQRPRVLVNGEPTDNSLALGTKGAQRVIVRTRGRAAHSAYPELGHSATRDLIKLLAELDTVEWPRDDMLGLTTVNIGAISGGVADNVIAPAAEARLMFRLVTPAREVQERVEHWIAGRAELEWGVMVPPVRLGVVDGFPTSIAAYATDIPALGNWGTPYLYGPGSIHVAHTPNESVSVSSLQRAVEDYVTLGRATVRA